MDPVHLTIIDNNQYRTVFLLITVCSQTLHRHTDVALDPPLLACAHNMYVYVHPIYMYMCSNIFFNVCNITWCLATTSSDYASINNFARSLSVRYNVLCYIHLYNILYVHNIYNMYLCTIGYTYACIWCKSLYMITYLVSSSFDIAVALCIKLYYLQINRHTDCETHSLHTKISELLLSLPFFPCVLLAVMTRYAIKYLKVVDIASCCLISCIILDYAIKFAQRMIRRVSLL